MELSESEIVLDVGDNCCRCDDILEPGQVVVWVPGLNQPGRAHE